MDLGSPLTMSHVCAARLCSGTRTAEPALSSERWVGFDLGVPCVPCYLTMHVLWAVSQARCPVDDCRCYLVPVLSAFVSPLCCPNLRCACRVQTKHKRKRANGGSCPG